MRKVSLFLSKKNMATVALSSLVAFFLVAVAAFATTISTNVDTVGFTTSGNATLGDANTDISLFTSKIHASTTVLVTGTARHYETLMLHNSASAPTAIEGGIYYDSTNKNIKLYDGANWFAVGTSTSGFSTGADLNRRINLTNVATDYLTIGTTTQGSVGGSGAVSMVTIGGTTTGTILLSLRASSAAQASDYFEIQNAAGTDLLTFDSNGRLGLGSTTPQGTLSIEQQTGAQGVFWVGDTGTATPHLLIDGSGNVGIGIDPTVKLHVGGALTATGAITFTNGALIVNEDAGDNDTRMESQNQANMFFLDASTDRIGVATSSPQAAFAVEQTAGAQAAFWVGDTGTATPHMIIAGDGRVGIGIANPTAKLDVSGSVIFNEGAGDNDFRAESQNQANMFFLDASTDRIGVATATPAVATFAIEQIGADSPFWIGDTGTSTPLLWVNGRRQVMIGSTTPTNAELSVLASTATTSVSVGGIQAGGSTNSAGCVSLRASNGTWYRLYVVAGDGSLKTEAGRCDAQ